jgi:hypothetical protein
VERLSLERAQNASMPDKPGNNGSQRAMALEIRKPELEKLVQEKS